MPRAYDRYPTARGMGGDSLYSPTRGGLPWQNPLEAITGTAADTVTAIGETIRQWLALDQFDAAFAEFGAAILGLNWTSPAAVRGAIAAGGKLVADLGAWILQVFQNITRLDLTGQTGFVHDLIDLLALEALYTAWDTFITGWSNLNWANPIAAIHPAWMLVVDLVWDVAAWAGQALENLIGVSLPAFFALGELRAHWTEFFTRWGTINWAHPLTAIHTAWMAVVDLVWNLADWAQTVLQNLTGIDLPSFFDTDALKGVWDTFTSEWAAISWTSLTAIWSALKAVGNLLRGLVHWAIGVFRNLTGIDLEAIAASFALDALVGAITLWANTITGINWLAPDALMTAIGAFVTLAQDLGNWVLGVLNVWLGWSINIVHGMFSGVDAFVDAVVKFFFGQGGLDTWNKVQDSLGGVGATITDTLRGAYDGIVGLVGALGSFLHIQDLVDFIDNTLGGNGLLGWLAGVPLIGPLVSALTGIKPGGGTALDLSTLSTWFRRTSASQTLVPAENIFGVLPAAVLGKIPVSAISSEVVNLLAQGNFNTADTVESGGGVDWDGATTATGTGGSMRFSGTGSSQRRYSRQVIPVAAGDRIQVAAMVKTAGFVPASGRKIVLSVIPWVGSVQSAEQLASTRTDAASGFSPLTGPVYRIGASATANSGDVVLPADVTALTLVVTAVLNSGATAWVDDAGARKVGALDQGNVDRLPAAWQGLWSGLVGGSGASKTSDDMQTAGSTARAATVVAQLAGTNAQTNVQTTWNDLFDGLGGTNGTTNATSSGVRTRANGVRWSANMGEVQAGQAIGNAAAVNTRVDNTNVALFNNTSPGADPKIRSSALPAGLAASTAGSGAMICRTANTSYPTPHGRQIVGPGFFDTITQTSADITISEGRTFTASIKGWYMVELSYRTGGTSTTGWRFAPLLYKNGWEHKIGTDVTYFWAVTTSFVLRYTQASWIVYLNAGESVSAGYDFDKGNAINNDIIKADMTGVETYFSIALLNCSYN